MAIDCEAVRRVFPQYRDLTDAEIAELVAFAEALIDAVLTDLERRSDKQAA